VITLKIEQNTYGIQVFNESVYHTLVDDFEKPGGYRDKLLKCHALAAEKDPKNIGNDEEVTAACVNGSQAMGGMISPYFEIGQVS
jgi:hypothetical protein